MFILCYSIFQFIGTSLLMSMSYQVVYHVGFNFLVPC